MSFSLQAQKLIERVMQTLDAGALRVSTDGGLAPTRFGGITGLTNANGLLIQKRAADGTTVLKHYGTDVVSIHQNHQWTYLAGGDDNDPDTQGSGPDALGVRWTFSRTGTPLVLNAGESFNFVVRANLTGLVEFRAQVQVLLLGAA